MRARAAARPPEDRARLAARLLVRAGVLDVRGRPTPWVRRYLEHGDRPLDGATATVLRLARGLLAGGAP